MLEGKTIKTLEKDDSYDRYVLVTEDGERVEFGATIKPGPGHLAHPTMEKVA